ncbi:hypothetical protein BJY04DRAFT_187163 [Aspergillus karnatakaensis]|uniref:flavin monoamine oxidase family protein n=1 Tax=Aspergillus karnatakaensis TaxID=1810916 RepID=UPI003CCD7D7B
MASPNASSADSTYDAIIIGAGISGLIVATVLHAAGLKIAVLEATHRVGGKILSVSSTETGFSDLGATWINDSTMSEMWKLTRKYGIETEIQRVEGDNVAQDADGGAKRVPYDFVPGERELVFKLIQIVSEEAEKTDLESPQSSPDAERLSKMTFREYCRDISNTETAKVFADQIPAAFVGVNGDEVSALCMLHYIKAGQGLEALISDHKDGGQYIRARTGMQTIPKRLAAELPPSSLVLSTPVTSITQYPSPTQPCRVETSTGHTFIAHRIVLSTPTPLHNSISFTPPLPQPRQILADTAVLGYYSKVVFIFAHPWWRDAGLSGTISALTGPISFTRDTSIPADDHWAISCFIVGPRGREWSKLSNLERYDAAWGQFKKCFRAAVENVPEPLKTFEMEWSKEEFLGGPCPVIPAGDEGVAVVGGELDKPFGKVHFVGTETATVWRGYMEGAVRSGQRGAREVLDALKM